MASQSNYNSFSIGFGEVPDRPVVKKNLDIYVKAIDKIDEKNQKAIAQRGAIDVALSQLEMDSSEDEWKYNYAKRIRDQIDAEAFAGDYSRALNTATMLATSAVSSPEVTGRVKAHADREQQLKEIKSRKDLSADDIEAWEILNPYKYKDKTDEQGHIIGGTKWEAETPPTLVNDIDKIAQVVSLIAYEQGSKSTDGGKDHTKSDGSRTASTGHSSNSYTRLTPERIEKQIRNAYEQDEEWKRSNTWKMKRDKALLNKCRNDLAKLEQQGITSGEEYDDLKSRINIYETNTRDANGFIADPVDIIISRYNTVWNNMAYNRVSTASGGTTTTVDKPDGSSGGGGFRVNSNGSVEYYDGNNREPLVVNGPSRSFAGSKDYITDDTNPFYINNWGNYNRYQ